MGEYMRFLLAAVAALVLAACGRSSDNQVDSQPTTGIIGGTLVAEGTTIAQSIVGIYDAKNEAICTGSLIADGIVLTAAHCVFDSEPNKLQIIFATDIMAVMGTSEPDIKAELMRDVVDFKYHEKYDPEDQEENEFDWSDIALIKFKGSAPAGYKPAAMMLDQKAVRPGLKAIMAGYGVTSVKTYPIEARKVKNIKEAIANGDVICDDDYKDCEEVSMSGDGELQETYATIAHVVRSEIRLDESEGRATCSGDSGGPIFLEQNGQYFIIGVTSRGSMLCNKVGVYTNVPYYRDWISFNLKKLQ